MDYLKYFSQARDFINSPWVQEYVTLANDTYIASGEASRNFILGKLDLDRYFEEKGYVTKAEVEKLILHKMSSSVSIQNSPEESNQ